jgi:hypothetical protein
MISETVNIPAKTDLSLFQSGAETTPGTSQVAAQSDIACVPTIKEKTLESFLYLQLRIEDDNAKADGEGVIRCATFEKSAN